MLFRDRPLLPSSVDADLYVARPRLEGDLLRPLEQHRNVLLLGDAGAGKTTLMRRTADILERQDQRTVWINAALADSPVELLTMVKEAIDEGRSMPEPVGEEVRENLRLLSLIRTLSHREPTVIFVDGLSDSQLSFDLFGRLRDELWATGHAWLVAARPKEAAGLRLPPAEAFWATVVEIPPLNEGEVSQFLSHGLEETEFHRLKKIPIKGFHPRLLIREVEMALVAAEEGAEIGTGHFDALLQKAAELGRSEEAALRELIGLGHPASAHDPELLGSLGWSRPYVQRILSHLEASGLVRSLPEPAGERTGRPRKLYEPNPEAVA